VEKHADRIGASHNHASLLGLHLAAQCINRRFEIRAEAKRKYVSSVTWFSLHYRTLQG
jgi:hypothetical protein